MTWIAAVAEDGPKAAATGTNEVPALTAGCLREPTERPWCPWHPGSWPPWSPGSCGGTGSGRTGS